MQTWMRIRLGAVYLFFLLFFGLIAFRLVQLQIIGSAQLSKLAKQQYERTKGEGFYRLPIFDRNGEELVVTTSAASIFARPRDIRSKKYTAKRLAQILGESESTWLRRLSTKKTFVWLRRQVDSKSAERIEKSKLRGVYALPEKKRVYPNGTLASHVLGFTDIDGKGLAGVEWKLDKMLRVAHSQYKFYRDGKGKPSYLSKSHFTMNSADDEGVFLTLDRRLQYVLEEALEKSVAETEAKAAMAIVMNPNTGEILALGQRPSYDPNDFGSYPASTYSNLLISHLYEPGSTLKVLLAAEAIAQHQYDPDTLIDCENGTYKVGGKSIRDDKHAFSKIPLKEVIQHSSNIGALKIAQKMGASGILKAMERFGLTQKTKVDLPGEAFAAARPLKEWTPLLVATAGFGQGVATTPLQMVTAFSSLANGGYAVTPTILIGDREKSEPKRILDRKITDTMKSILVSVTEKGTGTAARIEGLSIAGKTGTAQKYDREGGGYASGKYFSSFIGYLPADNPQLIIGVFIDEPKKDYYSAQVATPLFQTIARRSMEILDKIPKRLIAVEKNKTEKSLPVLPKSVQLHSQGEGQFVMPDLLGLSLRESLKVIGHELHNIKTSGSGFMEEQTPTAGTLVSPKTPIQLKFSTRYSS